MLMSAADHAHVSSRPHRAAPPQRRYAVVAFQMLDSARGRQTVEWFADAIKSSYDLVGGDDNGWCSWSEGDINCYEVRALPQWRPAPAFAGSLLPAGSLRTVLRPSCPHVLAFLAPRLVARQPFVNRGTIHEVVEFVEHDLGLIMRGIRRSCPRCKLGLSSVNRDLRRLSLAEMICSDFDFTPSFRFDGDPATTEPFPLRNCSISDPEWRDDPLVTSAPCCNNVRLGLASLTLIALDQIEPTPSATMERLEGRERAGALDRWVRSAVDRSEAVMQIVVISPDKHAVGVTYFAEWRNKDFLPELCSCSIQYWSFYFAQEAPYLGLAIAFCILSTLHEAFEQYGLALTAEDALRNLFSPFMLFVEFPTIVLPWCAQLPLPPPCACPLPVALAAPSVGLARTGALRSALGGAQLPPTVPYPRRRPTPRLRVAEILGPSLTLRSYAMFVSIIELLMFSRVFQEGQVLPPFRLVSASCGRRARTAAPAGVCADPCRARGRMGRCAARRWCARCSTRCRSSPGLQSRWWRRCASLRASTCSCLARSTTAIPTTG